MRLDIIRNNELLPTKWGGGATTQLYIYPSDSEYKAKNFDFRISTATVELEESDFTPLAGVKRQIMSLDGDLKLVHDESLTVELTPLQVHKFSGGTNTKSYGKCTDFNLMTTGNINAEMSHWLISKDHSANFTPGKEIEKVFFYLYKGELEISIESHKAKLYSGDFLVLDDMRSEEIIMRSDNEAITAAVYVFK